MCVCACLHLYLDASTPGKCVIQHIDCLCTWSQTGTHVLVYSHMHLLTSSQTHKHTYAYTYTYIYAHIGCGSTATRSCRNRLRSGPSRSCKCLGRRTLIIITVVTRPRDLDKVSRSFYSAHVILTKFHVVSTAPT